MEREHHQGGGRCKNWVVAAYIRRNSRRKRKIDKVKTRRKNLQQHPRTTVFGIWLRNSSKKVGGIGWCHAGICGVGWEILRNCTAFLENTSLDQDREFEIILIKFCSAPIAWCIINLVVANRKLWSFCLQQNVLEPKDYFQALKPKFSIIKSSSQNRKPNFTPD